jgi:hypothetical protein
LAQARAPGQSRQIRLLDVALNVPLFELFLHLFLLQ